MIFRVPLNRSLSIMGSAHTTLGSCPSFTINTIKYSMDADAPMPSGISTGGRVIWVDDAKGDDVTGSGSESYPYRSLRRGLQEAYQGNAVYLRSGVYAGE